METDSGRRDHHRRGVLRKTQSDSRDQIERSQKRSVGSKESVKKIRNEKRAKPETASYVFIICDMRKFVIAARARDPKEGKFS